MLLLHNLTTFGLHFLCVHPVLCPSSARSDQHSVGLCVVLQDGARDSHRDAQTFADLPTEKTTSFDMASVKLKPSCCWGPRVCVCCVCVSVCALSRGFRVDDAEDEAEV